MSKAGHIMQPDQSRISTLIKSVIILCFALVFLKGSTAIAQVITNQGAAITIVPGTVVGSKDAFNNPGGLISNDGEINLSGNYTSTATTNGNGFYRLGGNWTNTGGIFIPGTSTVVFNGPDNQLITRTGGESFFNMSVLNTGAPSLKSVKLADNATVLGTLWFSAGNIDAGTYVLYLSNPAAAALNYTSTTASRVIGKFQRGVSQTATYLFPLGNISHYNPANIRTNNISSTGTLLSEFLSGNPGNSGLPVPDPPVEIGDAYPGGYWRFTSNSFSSSDFHINLDASGFLDGGGIPDTIRDITRVIKRTSGGNWTVDGTHADAAGTVVYRNNLTGDISALGTEFALGRARPLITVHPLSQILCEAPTDAVFSVIATGAGPLTYRWYKDGVLITNGPHYSGARTNTLTVIGLVLTDAGTYYCIVSDKYRNKTQSNPATLVVNKRPVASATPQNQLHECSNISFEDIVLGETYGVPGTTYVWSRDNPANITTAIPVTGTAANIGDALTGSFINTSDDPITITFTITPIGPAPTLCVGLQPVVATLVINPTPRLIADNSLKQICYGGTTLITLTSPTRMTQGVVQFDYSVTTSSGAIVGNTSNDINLPVNYQIKRSYTNTSDTMQSVFYHITPKNVISGCNSGTIIVPQVKVHPEPLQSMFISVPFTCAGAAGGVLTSVLSRTTKPDRIHWTRPWRPDTIYYTNSNNDNLAIHFAGIYKVTVQDSMGCSNSSSNLFVSGAVFNSSMQVKETDTGFGTSCRGTADGEISIWEENSSTAVSPFEFWLVRNGLDTLGHGILPAKGYPNRAIVSSLPSGHYQLFIKDSNGCYNGDYPSADIMDPYPVEVTFDKSKFGNNNVSCLNYSDGSAWVNTIAGGNGSYTYHWTTLDGMIAGPDNLYRIDNIPAGTYYLTTTDLHNCTVQDTVVLTEPAGMTVSAFKLSSSPYGPLNIGCAGDKTGSIELTIAGGSGNYNYIWTGPGAFTASTKDIFNLGAGVYTATITDQANTTCIMLPKPTYTLTEPAPLNISSVGAFNISCHGGTGSVDITVTGGSAGTYVYTWSTANGSGIVPGQEDQPALTAGTYHLIVKDANNCSLATDFTFTEPAALTATLTPKHVTCNPPGFNNGSVDLTVTGGVSPYTYSWSNGPTTEDISGLTAGTYTVTIKDANNCILPGSVVVNPPAPVLFTKVLSDYGGFNVSCKGSANGSVNITTTSGLAPFSFSWQKSGGGFSAATEDIAGLKAGQYNLKITDSNLCEAIETIDITEPGKLSMTFTLSSSIAGGYNINCAGASTGSIDVEPVNAVISSTYLWSDGNTSKTRANIPAGNYRVVLTDANGCHADSTVTLTDPDSLKLKFDVTQPWCADKPDGEIRLTVTGGVVGTDYIYRWSSDNSTGSSITNILSGEFKVTVTDLNGCSIQDSVIVRPQRETCLIIPNAISPNGDLINDFWNIGLIELYPQIEVKVFNRWGQIVWRSEKGYPQPWDGRSNGSLLPVDSYHYIIDLHNGSKPLIGDITVIR